MLYSHASNGAGQSAPVRMTGEPHPAAQPESPISAGRLPYGHCGACLADEALA